MFRKILGINIIVCFFLTSLGPLPKAHANTILDLPAPGTMVNLSPAYEPVIIKGLTVHKDNPFLFDFIVDVGQDRMSGEPLKKEGEKLIKYFLASLAIPDKDVWVNLSPYEKNRMVPEALGQTDMGRDLLEQDYILKQITASLIYPEKQLGKAFWDKVYSKARQMYGTTQVPVNTFNKVWIMADRAEVFEHNQTAFVVDSHLKVMLEEDYLALSKHQRQPVHTLTSQMIKQIILPELEKEVNTGKNFANLRQIFNSIILSSWYKKNLKEALLNQLYADKAKVKGINLSDPTVKQQIFEQYLKAYKKGVFNYIKEDINSTNGEATPRKYFSGGINEAMAAKPLVINLTPANAAQLAGSFTINPLVQMATVMQNAAMASQGVQALMDIIEGTELERSPQIVSGQAIRYFLTRHRQEVLLKNIAGMRTILTDNDEDMRSYRRVYALVIPFLPLPEEVYKYFVNVLIEKSKYYTGDHDRYVRGACIMSLIRIGDNDPVARTDIRSIFEKFTLEDNQWAITQQALKKWRRLEAMGTSVDNIIELLKDTKNRNLKIDIARGALRYRKADDKFERKLESLKGALIFGFNNLKEEKAAMGIVENEVLFEEAIVKRAKVMLANLIKKKDISALVWVIQHPENSFAQGWLEEVVRGTRENYRIHRSEIHMPGSDIHIIIRALAGADSQIFGNIPEESREIIRKDRTIYGIVTILQNPETFPDLVASKEEDLLNYRPPNEAAFFLQSIGILDHFKKNTALDTGFRKSLEEFIREQIIKKLEPGGLNVDQVEFPDNDPGVYMFGPAETDELHGQEVLTAEKSISAAEARHQVDEGLSMLFKVKVNGMPDIIFLIRTLRMEDLRQPVTIGAGSRGVTMRIENGSGIIFESGEFGEIGNRRFVLKALDHDWADVFILRYDDKRDFILNLTPRKNKREIRTKFGNFDLTYEENLLIIDTDRILRIKPDTAMTSAGLHVKSLIDKQRLMEDRWDMIRREKIIKVVDDIEMVLTGNIAGMLDILNNDTDEYALYRRIIAYAVPFLSETYYHFFVDLFIRKITRGTEDPDPLIKKAILKALVEMGNKDLVSRGKIKKVFTGGNIFVTGSIIGDALNQWARSRGKRISGKWNIKVEAKGRVSPDQTVAEKVMTIIAKVTPDTVLNNWEIQVQIATLLEDEFGFEIPDEVILKKGVTDEEIIEYIESHTSAAMTAGKGEILKLMLDTIRFDQTINVGRMQPWVQVKALALNSVPVDQQQEKMMQEIIEDFNERPLGTYELEVVRNGAFWGVIYKNGARRNGFVDLALDLRVWLSQYASGAAMLEARQRLEYIISAHKRLKTRGTSRTSLTAQGIIDMANNLRESRGQQEAGGEGQYEETVKILKPYTVNTSAEVITGPIIFRFHRPYKIPSHYTEDGGRTDFIAFTVPEFVSSIANSLTTDFEGTEHWLKVAHGYGQKPVKRARGPFTGAPIKVLKYWPNFYEDEEDFKYILGAIDYFIGIKDRLKEPLHINQEPKTGSLENGYYQHIPYFPERPYNIGEILLAQYAGLGFSYNPYGLRSAKGYVNLMAGSKTREEYTKGIDKLLATLRSDAYKIRGLLQNRAMAATPDPVFEKRVQQVIEELNRQQELTARVSAESSDESVRKIAISLVRMTPRIISDTIRAIFKDQDMTQLEKYRIGGRIRTSIFRREKGDQLEIFAGFSDVQKPKGENEAMTAKLQKLKEGGEEARTFAVSRDGKRDPAIKYVKMVKANRPGTHILEFYDEDYRKTGEYDYFSKKTQVYVFGPILIINGERITDIKDSRKSLNAVRLIYLTDVQRLIKWQPMDLSGLLRQKVRIVGKERPDNRGRKVIDADSLVRIENLWLPFGYIPKVTETRGIDKDGTMEVTFGDTYQAHFRFNVNELLENAFPQKVSQAMTGTTLRKDKAALANPWERGGIDLNTSSGMRWKVSKDGRGVEMNVDPAMIERIRQIGIDSLSPVIFKITPVTSIWPLVGLQAPVPAERLAGV